MCRTVSAQGHQPYHRHLLFSKVFKHLIQTLRQRAGQSIRGISLPLRVQWFGRIFPKLCNPQRKNMLWNETCSFFGFFMFCSCFFPWFFSFIVKSILAWRESPDLKEFSLKRRKFVVTLLQVMPPHKNRVLRNPHGKMDHLPFFCWTNPIALLEKSRGAKESNSSQHSCLIFPSMGPALLAQQTWTPCC